jgi:hypothetical protein
MTPTETYSEYLWTSAETELGALATTVRYMAAEVGIVAQVAWKVGSAYYAWGISIDPDFAVSLPLTFADSEANEFGPIDGGTVPPIGTGYVDDPGFYDFTDWSFCVFDYPC